MGPSRCWVYTFFTPLAKRQCKIPVEFHWVERSIPERENYHASRQGEHGQIFEHTVLFAIIKHAQQHHRNRLAGLENNLSRVIHILNCNVGKCHGHHRQDSDEQILIDRSSDREWKKKKKGQMAETRLEEMDKPKSEWVKWKRERKDSAVRPIYILSPSSLPPFPRLPQFLLLLLIFPFVLTFFLFDLLLSISAGSQPQLHKRGTESRWGKYRTQSQQLLWTCASNNAKGQAEDIKREVKEERYLPERHHKWSRSRR